MKFNKETVNLFTRDKDLEEQLRKITYALNRLDMSEHEITVLVEALEGIYKNGMAHGAGTERVRRYTRNMIRNFTKLRTADVQQQVELTELLAAGLPEEEPDGGYEEVAEMLCCLRDDYYRADPQNTNPEARMNILRDHADALFIDGIVYGAFLAMQKYK